MGIKGAFRLFSIFSIGLLGLIFYFLIFNYFSGLEDSKESTLAKLKAIACTAALSVDGNLHNGIAMQYTEKNAIQSSTEDSSYFKIHQQLRQVQEVNDLESPIYTMVYDSAYSEFQFIVSSSETPYFRHHYQRYPQKLLEDFRTGGILDVYESENGVWLSAFAPITDQQDTVVGLVQVDQNFSSFLAIERKELIINSIISVLLIAPFFSFFFHYLKKRVQQEEQFKEQISKQNNEITHVNQVLTLKNLELDENKKVIESKNTELDSRVRQRTEELLRVNVELRNLLYRTSHDIMGPLATLQGLSQLAKAEFKDESFILFVDKFKNTTEDLIIRIKGLSKIYDAKNRQVSYKNSKPALILNQVLTALDSTEVSISNIQYNNKIPEGLTIKTDTALFYLAFHELLCFLLDKSIPEDYVNISYGSGKNNLHCFYIMSHNNKLNEDIITSFEKQLRTNENHLDNHGLRHYLAQSAIKKLEGTISLESNLRKNLIIKLCLKNQK